MIQNTRPRAAAVYDRVAGIYDLYTAPMEALGASRARHRLFGRATGRVLELGVGTGLNLPCYPNQVQLLGIDISPRMLERARRRAARAGRTVELEVADIQNLPYPDGTFDTVTAACVFCSVDDPTRGLREATRVLRPSGELLLYEHVRPRNPALAWVADVLSPLTRRMVGPEINRRTEDNVIAAGLRIRQVRRRGVWREIVATRSPRNLRPARPPLDWLGTRDQAGPASRLAEHSP
jgi:ubiquinone/menaquinone biosynthesis C-methylase UbiE